MLCNRRENGTSTVSGDKLFPCAASGVSPIRRRDNQRGPREAGLAGNCWFLILQIEAGDGERLLSHLRWRSILQHNRLWNGGGLAQEPPAVSDSRAYKRPWRMQCWLYNLLSANSSPSFRKIIINVLLFQCFGVTQSGSGRLFINGHLLLFLATLLNKGIKKLSSEKCQRLVLPKVILGVPHSLKGFNCDVLHSHPYLFKTDWTAP